MKPNITDCFSEIGCLSQTHHIVTNLSIQPVVHPPRRLQLQRMITLKIIVPIQEPTDWVNSLVAVGKSDGTLRLCLDP